jgi:superoxide dismutase, Fe-Mn family
MSFEQEKLTYSYNDLEPYIDSLTMEIHYTKHHAAYVNNLNAAVKELNLDGQSLEALMAKVSGLPAAIRNNGGGHYNHSLFWRLLSSKGGGVPSGNLAKAIDSSFGSFALFKEAFTKAALTRFGSGWAWLVQTQSGLVISSTPNQDNPLMDVAEVKGFPIIGVDVWEHAYYLKYQNRRNDYLDAFWNVLSWEEASLIYNSKS